MVAAVVAMLAVAPLPSRDFAPRPELVRVLLNRIGAVARVVLSSAEGFELFAPGQEAHILVAKPGQEAVVSLEAGKLRVGSKQFDQVLALPLGKTMTVAADKAAQYRGRVRTLVGAGRLMVVNELGLEAYLMGVVPAEAPASFHPEALKAQAVAARTFALAKMQRAGSAPFDLDDTTASQSYLGVAAEKPQTNVAVRETANQVLLHGGEPIQALYCTVSGGVTAANEEAFGGAPLPYLRSVRDADANGSSYGAWSPHHSWEFHVRAYPGVGAVKDVEVLRRTGSGRAAAIRVSGERGTLTVSGPAFRNAVGVNNLKSLLIDTIEATGQGVRIRGRGWGHGVGMCQAGAQGRALSGQTHDGILATYYPGARLTFLPEPVLFARGLLSSASGG